MFRPETLEPGQPVVTYQDFAYRADTWDRPRRVVSKIEMMWMLPVPKGRRAPWRACQPKSGPLTLTTGGDICRSRLPRPDVQASEAQMAKYHSQ